MPGISLEHLVEVSARFLASGSLNVFVDTVLKALAAVAACVWFAWRSAHRTRMNMSQLVDVSHDTARDDDISIVKAIVCFENVGEVPIKLQSLTVGAQQLLPLPAEIRKLMQVGNGLIDEVVKDKSGEGSAWSGLAVAQANASEKHWEVEIAPGETETVLATLRADLAGVQQFEVISQAQDRERWPSLFGRAALNWRARTVLREGEPSAGQRVWVTIRENIG